MRRSVLLLLVEFAVVLAVAAPARASAAPPVALEYAVEHVIFGRTQLDLLTTGRWAYYVHDDRDSFLLMSGNNEGAIDCELLNSWAEVVRSHYPTVLISAATSGIQNVIAGAPCLDNTLFTGMTLVYEPNQENAPEFTWNRAGTEALFEYAANTIRAHGLQAWTKISGRATAGRDKFGEWDYGVTGTLLDGQIVQTQASCRDLDEDGDYVTGRREFGVAIESVRDMLEAAGSTSQLHVRVTTSSDETNVNSVPAAAAEQCARIAWATPGVARVTLRTAVGDHASIERATQFYQLRGFLMNESQSAGAAPPGAQGSELDPGAGTMQGELPQSGMGFVLWGGGPLAALLSAAAGSGCLVESVWVAADGAFVGYIVDAPAAINASFTGRFPGAMPPREPVLVRCRETGAA